MERIIIKGANGSIIAEQNKDLKEKLKILEEDRDKYESFFNQAQFEKKTKDNKIKILQEAIVINDLLID